MKETKLHFPVYRLNNYHDMTNIHAELKEVKLLEVPRAPNCRYHGSESRFNQDFSKFFFFFVND